MSIHVPQDVSLSVNDFKASAQLCADKIGNGVERAKDAQHASGGGHGGGVEATFDLQVPGAGAGSGGDDEGQGDVL